LARFVVIGSLLFTGALAGFFVYNWDSEKNLEKELTADSIIAILALPATGG